MHSSPLKFIMNAQRHFIEFMVETLVEASIKYAKNAAGMYCSLVDMVVRCGGSRCVEIYEECSTDVLFSSRGGHMTQWSKSSCQNKYAARQ